MPPSKASAIAPCSALALPAAADPRDLRRTGDEAYIYRLEFSKTQQASVTVDSTPGKPILGRSAQALSAWLPI